MIKREKLEKEVIQQQRVQEELKNKQRHLQENEETIKRQIKIWKDLQVNMLHVKA
jgi:hypothetical protein